MKTIYHSGISRGLVIFITLVMLPCYALMIYLSLWIGLALLGLITAVIADAFINTRYTIEERTLWVQCGIFEKKMFDIGLITEMPGQYAAAAKRTINKQVYQILMTIMSAAIWYPFFKAADNQAVAEEKAGALAEQPEE